MNKVQPSVIEYNRVQPSTTEQLQLRTLVNVSTQFFDTVKMQNSSHTKYPFIAYVWSQFDGANMLAPKPRSQTKDCGGVIS